MYKRKRNQYSLALVLTRRARNKNIEKSDESARSNFRSSPISGNLAFLVVFDAFSTDFGNQAGKNSAFFG